MPSCIVKSLSQSIEDRSVEHRQSRLEVALEMYPQRAAAAFGQHVEIAARLRRLDHAKTRLLAGHREILGIVGGDLQEDAAVRPAFVGLPGGMQEARPEFRAGRDMALVANR